MANLFYRNEHDPLLLSPAAKKALVTAAVYKAYHLKVENFPFYGQVCKLLSCQPATSSCWPPSAGHHPPSPSPPSCPTLASSTTATSASPCALEARVDSSHESQDGKVGHELKEEIGHKFDKWQEPAPVKQVKVLPALLDGQRKKRGSWQYQKMKEYLGLTEIHKQANRMSFGEIEEDTYHEDLGFSLGHLGKASSNHVRQTQVNKDTKAQTRKTQQRTLQEQSVVYKGKSMIWEHSSGTASSMAFSHLQGVKSVNPQAAKKWLRSTRNISPAWPSSSRSRVTKMGSPSPLSPLEPIYPTPNSWGAPKSPLPCVKPPSFFIRI
ncbi:hypothetical protein DUI87_10778 [Hirundo rustica rustica]|uniref:Prp31 C-terminal domain-containing protein n=1 Tax=Hirundo rustica rustica TaxID=333673 RepID=A0A3M0KPM9_HIRRU|nr:hypothetical protein DUI87_10778 [Hirundo rustica rustica]